LAKRILISPSKLGELRQGWAPMTKRAIQEQEAAATKKQAASNKAALNLFSTVHLHIINTNTAAIQ